MPGIKVPLEAPPVKTYSPHEIMDNHNDGDKYVFLEEYTKMWEYYVDAAQLLAAYYWVETRKERQELDSKVRAFFTEMEKKVPTGWDL